MSVLLCLSVSSDLILPESLGLGFMSSFKRKYKIKCMRLGTSYRRSSISYKIEVLAIYFMYASQRVSLSQRYI